MTTRPDAPGPLMRRGPRPLLLHLTLATLRSTVSRAMSPHWNADWPTSSGAAVLHGLRSAVRDGNLEGAFPAEVMAETLRQDAALIAGIAAYRRHPWRRTLTDPPTVWSEGDSRLLDYGAGTAASPVLFVPSLINRAYVLDLAEGHSMLRWLAQHGVRPFLLDWGWPGETERRFTLTDYVAGRMERAITAAAELTGEPLVLAGYCMGGTLAVAAAQRRPDLIRGLTLLAAPWDFHAADRTQALQVAASLPLLEPALTFNQALPVDLLQSLFALLDPWGVPDKYRGFSRLDQASDRAKLIVALEDWLNDGVPLAAEVARVCLGEWYGENAPARGTWRIAGLPVDPRAIAMPAFVAVPRQDRIVPPDSARSLAGLIPKAALHEPAAGHIGMTAGARAERELWRPLLDWLQNLSPSMI
ncbi:alpha/beta fold hydrolase [Rhodopila sp.]|uniref:alpha/beta fold hydrolase n=1 Tax=Rhodopila sp. TaxID=2480087 RepID=UPI003D146B46